MLWRVDTCKHHVADWLPCLWFAGCLFNCDVKCVSLSMQCERACSLLDGDQVVACAIILLKVFLRVLESCCVLRLPLQDWLNWRLDQNPLPRTLMLLAWCLLLIWTNCYQMPASRAAASMLYGVGLGASCTKRLNPDACTNLVLRWHHKLYILGCKLVLPCIPSLKV